MVFLKWMNWEIEIGSGDSLGITNVTPSAHGGMVNEPLYAYFGTFEELRRDLISPRSIFSSGMPCSGIDGRYLSICWITRIGPVRATSKTTARTRANNGFSISVSRE